MTDRPLTHRVDGQGPPESTLLLLNGGFMSIASWEAIAEPLGRERPVLRCDFRGQLLTPGPAHRTLGPNVEDLVDLLDGLGLEKVHVAGTSFGGEVGLLFAARYPDRVSSLAAITVTDRSLESMREGGERLRRVVDRILSGEDPGIFHDRLVEDVYSWAWAEENRELLASRREQIGRLPESWFRALDSLLAAVEDFDLTSELGSIVCPTLVVVAGDDRVLPPERGRSVAHAIRGAALVEHPSSGHALVMEQPDWLVARIAEFLRTLTIPTPRLDEEEE